MTSTIGGMIIAESHQMCLGTVVSVSAGLRVAVRCKEVAIHPVECEVLQTSGAEPLGLCEGDTVLFWIATDSSGRGVVLGRVGPTRTPCSSSEVEKGAPPRGAVPDTLVLEAKHSLTLRVGDGSITIRADGKILIKGKDLVSHAQRVNRIKGGSVAIN